MGRYYLSDLVPFAISGIYEGDSQNLYEEKNWLIVALAVSLEDVRANDGDPDKIDFKGWITGDDCFRIGRDKQLYAFLFTKDNHKVYSINEHQDSAGGAIYLTVCANDEESLKQFMDDFDIANGSVGLGGNKSHSSILADYICKQVL